jgi:protein SCO1
MRIESCASSQSTVILSRYSGEGSGLRRLGQILRGVPLRMTLGALCIAFGACARAQTTNPTILNGVGIEQKLDAQVPGDLKFTDENGATVQLSQYYGKRPIVLTLVYYKCPMLCTMVLNDLNRVLGAMQMNVGEQFDIVTVSFDPTEGPELAAKKKKQYVHSYGRPHAEEGWHFLTGDEDSIKKLTDTVGFHYAWDPKWKQYAHASGIMVLTPEGKVSKYFYGVEYSARDLRLALTEAGGGKIGSPSDVILLYCFHYDPATGKYSLIVTRFVQLAALLTMGALGTFWFVMYRQGRKQQDTAA